MDVEKSAGRLLYVRAVSASRIFWEPTYMFKKKKRVPCVRAPMTKAMI